MSRADQMRRFLRWAATALALACAAVWALSGWWVGGYARPGWFCMVAGGEAMLGLENPFGNVGVGYNRWYGGLHLGAPRIDTVWAPGVLAGVPVYVCPLWLPTAVFASLALVSWWWFLWRDEVRWAALAPACRRWAPPAGWLIVAGAALLAGFLLRLDDPDALVVWAFLAAAAGVGAYAARGGGLSTAAMWAVVFGAAFFLLAELAFDWSPGVPSYRREFQEPDALRRRRFLGGLVIFAATLIAYALTAGMIRRFERRLRDAGRCMGCGYDLTGNVSGRCPECGRATSPGIDSGPAPREAS